VRASGVYAGRRPGAGRCLGGGLVVRRWPWWRPLQGCCCGSASSAAGRRAGGRCWPA
jgi:hypothetical protein